jgi:hypothetical protein
MRVSCRGFAVADTSPICYLVLIGEVDLPPALLSEVPREPATPHLTDSISSISRFKRSLTRRLTSRPFA